MNMTADAAPDGLRAEVRAFLRERLPAAVRDKVRLGVEVSREETVAWQRALAERGWLVPHWPPQWGGTGWSTAQREAFQEEMAIGHAPEPDGLSFEMIGPLLIRHGTDAQKRHFLPRMTSLEHVWCQGYSEPGAGSDLASLKTRAVRVDDDDGGHYVVDGSKIWTSNAHRANWIFCLVRTDVQARAQEGISFLLIDMATPGVSVRPIVGIHGWHLFNQVFLDGVKVPVGHRLGEENQGWGLAKSLLEFERLNLARVGENRRRLAKVRVIGEQVHEAGEPLSRRPWFRQRLAELEVRLEALAATVRALRRQAQAGRRLGPETGMLKLVGSRLVQDLDMLAVDALGPQTLAWDRDAHFDLAAHEREARVDRHPYAATASSRRFVSRGFTIAGGSSEIQHELLAKQVLGL